MTQNATIEYPTEWTYKIIAQSESEILDAIAITLGEKARIVVPSKQSAGGRFLSMELKTIVNSHEERESIFHRIFKEKGIKLVL